MSLVKIGSLNFPADEGTLKLFKQIQIELGFDTQARTFATIVRDWWDTRRKKEVV